MKALLKKLTIYAGAALIVISASAAYAMPMHEGEEGERCEKGARGEKFQAILDKLDLTQEQKDQLKQTRETQKQQKEGLKEDLESARKTLHEELKKYDSDRSVVKSTVARINVLQAQLLEQKTDSFLAMKGVLTPQQFQKMQEIMDEKRQKMKDKKSRKKGKFAPEE